MSGRKLLVAFAMFSVVLTIPKPAVFPYPYTYLSKNGFLGYNTSDNENTVFKNFASR